MGKPRNKESHTKLMWTIIESLDWHNRSHTEERAYDKIKFEFMHNYSERIAGQVREFVNARLSELYTAHDKYTESGVTAGYYGGDDSFSDMMNHVVGMGQKTFNAVMKDMTKLNKIKWVESFSYALPYTGEKMNDYENISLADDSERLEEAIHLATETFWFSISESYPEIKTGDVSLDEVLDFENAMKEAVKKWVKNNEPK